MISRISNNIFVSKVQYAKTTPSFGFLDARDEFIRNHKLKGTKMSDSIDDKVNIKNDKSHIISSFAEKKDKLPLCFDLALGITMGYLKNNIDAQTYTEIFVSEAPFVFQTAQYGVDKEKFSQKYFREIDLVRDLNLLCGAFKRSECSEGDFNSKFYGIMENYTKS